MTSLFYDALFYTATSIYLREREICPLFSVEKTCMERKLMAYLDWVGGIGEQNIFGKLYSTPIPSPLIQTDHK